MHHCGSGQRYYRIDVGFSPIASRVTIRSRLRPTFTWRSPPQIRLVELLLTHRASHDVVGALGVRSTRCRAFSQKVRSCRGSLAHFRSAVPPILIELASLLGCGFIRSVLQVQCPAPTGMNGRGGGGMRVPRDSCGLLTGTSCKLR